MFSGIPITERLAENERNCGVCVIDLRNGQVVALLRFETGVREVFAIAVLIRTPLPGPDQRGPESIGKFLRNPDRMAR